MLCGFCKIKKTLFRAGSNRSINLKRNIVGSLLLKGISILVSLMLVPATIGYVNPELYGVWLALSSMMAWLGFADLGFSQGLKNKLTEAIAEGNYERGKTLVSTTYFMMIVIFIPLCFFLELIVPFVNWTNLLNVDTCYLNEITQVMHILVAFACVQMIVNVMVSVVASFQKVALSNSFLVIGNVLSLFIIYMLRLFCPPSLINLAYSISAMPVLITFLATVILFKSVFKRVSPSIYYVRKEYVKDLFGLGYKFFIINVQVLVLYQSTNILISYVSSPIEVTNYNIAYKLMNCAMMFFSIITAPLWPAYTDAYVRGDYNWMKNMRNKMQNLLWLSILICICFAIFSQPIYRIWIGNNISVSYTMTLAVTIYVIIYCWMSLNCTLIVGMGKIYLETCLVLFGMLFHIPASLALSHFWGSYGVLFSLIFINLLYGVVMNIQVNKLLEKKAFGIWNR